MPKVKATKAERARSLATLRQLFPDHSTVYCIVRRVSASGMQRDVSVIAFHDGQDVHPNYAAAVAIG